MKSRFLPQSGYIICESDKVIRSGAPSETRTRTNIRSQDFKSCVSTYSTTGASPLMGKNHPHNNYQYPKQISQSQLRSQLSMLGHAKGNQPTTILLHLPHEQTDCRDRH